MDHIYRRCAKKNKYLQNSNFTGEGKKVYFQCKIMEYNINTYKKSNLVNLYVQMSSFSHEKKKRRCREKKERNVQKKK